MMASSSNICHRGNDSTTHTLDLKLSPSSYKSISSACLGKSIVYMVCLILSRWSDGLSDDKYMPINHAEEENLDGSAWPTGQLVSAVLKRVQTELPIIAAMLMVIQTALEAAPNQEREVFWEVVSVAFFGFFCLRELLLDVDSAYTQAMYLMWGDITCDSHDKPSMLWLQLERSNCDQVWHDVDMFIRKTGNELFR